MASVINAHPARSFASCTSGIGFRGATFMKTEAGVAENPTYRVRHRKRRTAVLVKDVTRLSTSMLMVELQAPELKDLASASFDDHISLVLPHAGDFDGPQLRKYTPLALDRSQGSLSVMCALRGAGPATRWASSMRQGQYIEIEWPRESTVIAQDFDWYLLMGDETAIPAMVRAWDELPGSAAIVALALIDDGSARISIPPRQRANWKWTYRKQTHGHAAELIEALTTCYPRTGDGYAWIAGESFMTNALEAALIERFGHNPEWLRATAYWHPT